MSYSISAKPRAAWLNNCEFSKCNNAVGRTGAKGFCSGHYKQLITGRPLCPLQNRIMADPAPIGCRTCRKCFEELSIQKFAANKRESSGLSSYCRRCESFSKKLRNHGVSEEKFYQMLVNQNYCCAVGGETISEKNACIDHDHSCCEDEKSCGNCVRGLLCSNCNTGLGLFQDNQNKLLRAVKYLRGGEDN